MRRGGAVPLEPMRCRRCGHQNEAGANFGSSCGASLGAADETTMSLRLLEDRQELEAELGALLDDLPADLGMLVARRGPTPASTFAPAAPAAAVRPHPHPALLLDDRAVSRPHPRIRPTPAGHA